MAAPSFSFSSPYPQPEYEYPSSTSRVSINSKGSRAPLQRPSSPTPSERIEINQPFLSLRKYLRSDVLKRPKVILWAFFVLLILVLTSLIALYHKQIENWLRPAATWMQQLKFGWLIPIAILFVISFPPLFGHEIVAVLCGNVWGLWIGFGIVAAGTVLGEIGNFYAFRYVCQSRADKAEHSSWWYACLARAVRQGGFKIAVMARLSAIPGHFTTAIFATCGMNIFIFTIAAILSMPKQFITVYLGVLLEESDDPTNKPNSKHSIISYSVLAVTTLITIGAGWYVYRKMSEQKLAVVRERRAKLGRGLKMGVYEPNTVSMNNDPNASASSLDAFNTSNLSQFQLVRTTATEPPREHRSFPQVERGGATGYDDAYDYNAYPPPGGPPPSDSFPNPYGTQYPPSVQHAAYPQRHTPAVTDIDAERGPDSPFDDRHAMFPPSIPVASITSQSHDAIKPTEMHQNHLPPPSYGGHQPEETETSFYTSHSRFTTTDSSMR